MPYFLAPDPVQGQFFVPGTNTPAAGALIFTYLTGTTTKVTVYQDDAGAASHTNPIVLDSGGNLPSASAVWLLGGQSYRFVWAPANDTDPPASSYRTIDDVDGINDVGIAESLQWISGPTPTFVGATQLTLSGDQTGNAQIGRRIETENTGGTIYSTITSSVFSASTTAIGVNNDSGSLDAGLSSLNYGLLTRVDPSIPILTDFYPLRSSSSDATKNLRIEIGAIPSSTTVVETIPIYNFRPATQNRGAQVSSQSTTNVSTATGDLIEITNTNAINQITMFNGQLASLLFQTTTPLNFSANLPLPGSINMTTAAGDVITLRGTSTDAVIVQGYQLRGTPALQAGLNLITATTVTNITSVTFPNLGAAYDEYECHLVDVIPATDNTQLQLRVSSSNGASFFSTNGHYAYSNVQGDLTTLTAAGTNTDAQINVCNNASNSFINSGSNMIIRSYMLANIIRDKAFTWQGGVNTTTGRAALNGHGATASSSLRTAVMDAFQLLYSSGNISTGTFYLYGVRKA